MRSGRKNDELRPFSLEKGFQPGADASVLIRMGGTHVLCAVTVEDSVPPFLKGTGKGWITAEYGMLPCATNSRGNREAVRGQGGRTFEIQRLIGRSLRMMVDLAAIGERTLRVDCDVLNADGGTRCASITGAAIAINDALCDLHRQGKLDPKPKVVPVAAVSVCLLAGGPMLDPDYPEDRAALADANFVMTADLRLIEAQCTAEGRPLSRDEFEKIYAMAAKGIRQLFSLGWKNLS